MHKAFEAGKVSAKIEDELSVHPLLLVFNGMVHSLQSGLVRIDLFRYYPRQSCIVAHS